MREAAGRLARVVAAVGVASACGWTCFWCLGQVATVLSGSRQAPWVVGRASGLTAYLLLVAVVSLGLVLARPVSPGTAARGRLGAASRIRVHAVLATFTLAFTVLHVVVLATDRYAGVGWLGALLPLGATYRPVPVTLGVIGLYAGLLSGVTAALAGRIARRIWWPLHKVSAAALVLVWAHGATAGTDWLPLRVLYAVTGVGVLALAVSRYAATSSADRRAATTAEPGCEPVALVPIEGLP